MTAKQQQYICRAAIDRNCSYNGTCPYHKPNRSAPWKVMPDCQYSPSGIANLIVYRNDIDIMFDELFEDLGDTKGLPIIKPPKRIKKKGYANKVYKESWDTGEEIWTV